MTRRTLGLVLAAAGLVGSGLAATSPADAASSHRHAQRVCAATGNARNNPFTHQPGKAVEGAGTTPFPTSPPGPQRSRHARIHRPGRDRVIDQ